ncbi:MAG: cobalamin-dependent protein [Bacteroidetes bacterium]|jgi:methylmalonyl-CoA mutase C-terminal domain/subunit|nr:cobalamin-dependent protein [Bacteroidota bacterium]
MKVLLAKPGLDGHDVGVKVLAHGLIDAGFEVVYTGLRKSIEDIVDIAIKNKVDIIGLSILSGTHLLLSGRMKEVMDRKKLTTPWFVGGNIPANDIEELKKLGASEAFPTGSKVADVVLYFNTIKVVA